MTRVLFVCMGNICRSPMAHGVFQHRLRERGLQGEFLVDSAGTHAYHTGERPDPRTLSVLKRHGIDLDHRARQVHADDFERFDWILAMDEDNRRNLLARANGARVDHVRLMLEPIGGGNVEDPYFGGPDGFDVNYRQLTRAVDAWLEHMA